ncbi:GNAT family N-acetyltransferase [Aliivibrio salmonicida]|uniref:Acetyltransferase n=1 Tax=Aliivibrio salmonicida (strain LFI1238) TaxID=316275 RepID=B6EKT6_ALISL|nr:GNAT family N-acetyltransferase [Aliivibrio salmonicida]AZL84717.1 GNAT family N-acetyltransferase [Aliivibrio salmonicida]CAQ79109.1 putative acetyltransferase [Aliivibrio salmonicida LFI1238]
MDRIIFQKVTACEYPSLFSIYKKYLYSAIEDTFGWDEGFQTQHFADSYRKEWFEWIMFNGERLGFICVKQEQTSVHFHLLLIFEKYQNKGVGSAVMKYYQRYYSDRVIKVSLSAFKCNQKVIDFYSALGYQITGENEHFFDMERSLCFNGYLGTDSYI